MQFRFTGLPLDPFRDVFELSDRELLARGMRRYIADSKPGFLAGSPWKMPSPVKK